MGKDYLHMEPWEKLELQYASRLRSSTREERRTLYTEAYSAVSTLRIASFTSEDPEKRTAGTSKSTVEMLARLCRQDQIILEVGCGRGFTCLGLASHVKEIVGTDVSDPSLDEARRLLAQNGIANARFVNSRADELTKHFAPSSFDKVISIDTYEHLHPEDGAYHLRDVYAVLKSGGVYILIAPNRIAGPSDITRRVCPSATKPQGFHLNEPTYRDLIIQMREIGFRRFRSVVRLSSHVPWLPDLWYPAYFCSWAEAKYSRTKLSCLRRFLRVVLMATKIDS